MDTFPDFTVPGFDIDRYNQRFYNSNVVIRASAKSVEYPTHWSPLSLKCVLSGEEHYETTNGRYVVDEDHFLVFNNGKMYSSWIDSPVDVNSFTLNIAPSFERLATQSIVTSAAKQLEDPFDRSRKRFRFTERLYRHGNSLTNIIQQISCVTKDAQKLDQCFYDLIHALLFLEEGTNEEIGKIDKVNAATKREVFQRLVRAHDLIYSCYKNKLTIEDMANTACMNPFYFLRQFKKAFRISPHQLLTKRRMEVSMQLLKTTKLPVSDVCLDVGFSDASSFTKLFRKHYGFPPSALRM